MDRPENERDDAPRCPVCGKWMQPAEPGEKAIEYECCGRTELKFRPQFRQPPEQYADVGKW